MLAAVGLTVSAGLLALACWLERRPRRAGEGAIAELLTDTFDILKIETRDQEDAVHKADILGVVRTSYGFDATIKLPRGYAVDKFRDKLPAIEQSCVARITLKHLRGREVLLKLGMKPIRERMDYDESLLVPGELSLPYYTPYGVRYLDFSGDSTCHLIVAGATRMGKTVFLRLLFAHLIVATGGKIKFLYINNKLEDYYPLAGIPQLPHPAETIDEAFDVLREARIEIDRRKTILRTSRDSVNVRQYNEKHPEAQIPPLFVVFDEYGRFAESEELQEVVTEIAETAGYLDVHLVIATQRPDATTVLKPRIRANILTRVCFQTADENNSKIVVHTPEAHHLGEIRGRAIVLDGMPQLAQIPYISEDRAMELLQPFRSDENEQSRQEDSGTVKTLPSFVKGPVGNTDLPGRSPAMGDRQPDNEKARPRRARNNRTPA